MQRDASQITQTWSETPYSQFLLYEQQYTGTPCNGSNILYMAVLSMVGILGAVVRLYEIHKSIAFLIIYWTSQAQNVILSYYL